MKDKFEKYYSGTDRQDELEFGEIRTKKSSRKSSVCHNTFMSGCNTKNGEERSKPRDILNNWT